MSSEEQFTEDIRVRVPKEIRDGLQRLKRKRLKKESELVREALLDYLARNGEIIPDITGGPLDTPEQLSARIQHNEAEPGRVANEAAKRAIGELPAALAKPTTSAADEEKVERIGRKVVGKVKREVARLTREKHEK